MSFNIRFDNPEDGQDAWPHRKEMVAGVARFHQADIVGTQEALINQINDLDEMLDGYEWVGVGRDEESDGNEYCAIFYRSDRFELREEDTFWLSETPEKPASQGWDAALPRIVTWARLVDRYNDQSFYVFNTHFDHQGEEARRQSAELILSKIDDITADEPVIVLGDLNVTEDEDPYRILVDADRGPAETDLKDGYYSSEYPHYGPTGTWTGFEQIYEDRRIDYILVNSGFHVRQHGIIADQQEGRFPSDHLPVLAEITFDED